MTLWFGNCYCKYSVCALTFLILFIHNQAECQRLFTQSTGRTGSRGWKVPGRHIAVDVIPRSTFGNVRTVETQSNSDGEGSRNDFAAIPYLPGLLGDINLIKLSSSNDIDSEDPPPHQEVAKMARFIVLQSMWTSLATISSRGATIGSPFSTILSVSEGTAQNSTGIPYMYLTPLDLAAIDLKVNNTASLVMTLAQGGFCKAHGYDPEDPRCAMVSFTGRMVQVKKGSDEEKFAKSALFYKHPVMKTWPKGHNWFVAKLDITQILVRDYFGGARSVTLSDYLAADPKSRSGRAL